MHVVRIARRLALTTSATLAVAAMQPVALAHAAPDHPRPVIGGTPGTHWNPPARTSKQRQTSTTTATGRRRGRTTSVKAGDTRMSMAAVSADATSTITFSEFPTYTYISDQYAPQGIVFAGQDAVPEIVTDGANPTSPVLEGGPGYVGDIRGSFVLPGTHTPASVDSFSLDVGYIDDPQSTELYVFGAHGQLLGSILATNYGIIHMTSTFHGATYFVMHSDFSDGSGWAIDNVTIGAEYAASGAPLPAVGLGGGMNSRYNPTCNTSEPVNCASGNFWHTFDDVTVPGRGPGLDLSRTYNSLNADRDSIFGRGWSSSYDEHLVAHDDGSITIAFPDGSRIDAQPDPITGQYAVPAFADSTLSHDGSGWVFTSRHTGLSSHFDASGFLTSVADRNGETTTIARDAAGVPTLVTDAAGRTLTFASDADGHVTSVTDPLGRTFGYSYDQGQLTATTDPVGKTWQLGYAADGSHLLTSMTDPRGHSLSNVYDAGGRVTSQTDYAGHTTTLAYSGDAFSTDGGTTTITDPRGKVSTEQYTGGQLVSLTRGTGTPVAATWTYAYDPATYAPTMVTDPDGHTTTSTYDFDGNRLTTTDATGVRRSATYNDFDEVLTSTDGNGWTTYSYYDGAGNLTDVYRPLDSSNDYAHTQVGHDTAAHPADVTSVVDPDGHTWKYTYDSAGDLATVTDPDGHATVSGYDGLGRRTSVTTARGGETSFGYDDRSQLVRVTDATGGITRHEYDANGNLVSTTDADGHTSTTTYDFDNHATSVTRADGSTLTYSYDDAGNRTARTNGDNHTTTYAYDALNRATGVTDPLGRTTTFAYDGAGNQVSTIDPSGRTTAFGYDANNQLVSVDYSDPQTHDVTFAYDANRRRTTMVDGSGTSSYSYDVGNRLTSVTNGSGATTGYGWDAANHMTSIAYDSGRTVTRGYDAEGRLASVTDWNGRTTTFGYNADGQLDSEQYANGVTTAITNDLGGAVTGITDTAGASTLASFDYTRDASRQVTSETSTGVGQPAQAYTYNPLDQLSSRNGKSIGYTASDDVVDAAAGTLTYDAADQVTSLTPATGPALTFSYDKEGERLSGVNADGAAMSYAYDQAGRLTDASTAGGATSALGLLAGGTAHSLALADGDAVYAWGANESGELGDGGTAAHKTPEKVLTGAAGVAAGAQFSVAAMDDGTVQTWGDNSNLQLGAPAIARRTTPGPVTGLTGVTSVAAGNYHALALLADGTVSAWGLNSAGELGDGTTTSRSAPVKVKGLSGVTQVAAGGLPGWAGHSVALTGDGSVWAWGYGKSGQLGRGALGTSGTPAKVPGLSTVTQVAAGGDNTYALKADGTVWAWGDNSFGQIGNSKAGKTQSSPLQVTGLSNVVRIGAGGVMAFAVTADGTVWGWGDDNTGQLGDGGACGKTCGHPVKVGSIGTGVTAVGGYVHGLAALKDGSVRAWGSNTGGQVGDGTTTVRLTPVTVAGLSGVTTTGGGSSARVQYAYDGDGLRVSTTSAGATSAYRWDVASPMPMLLSDDSWSYVYGPGGRPVEQVAADGTTQFLHGDQVGSTRLVTDASGGVVATFSYSPYGVTEAKSGSADTRLRYAGQYQDATTGLYYLRARDYDPVTAQFLTRDPLEALTGAAYGYAGQNPLTFVDPMGLDWWNPFSWSGKTWAAVGTGVAVVGLTVATAGVGDVVLIGGVAVTEVTADVVVSEVGVDATFTAASYVEGGLTADEVVTGAGRLVAAGATARGGYDTYQCVHASDPSRALECGMDAGATMLSAFDPFLQLGPFGEYLYNVFGYEWAAHTPEGGEEGGAGCP